MTLDEKSIDVSWSLGGSNGVLVLVSNVIAAFIYIWSYMINTELYYRIYIIIVVVVVESIFFKMSFPLWICFSPEIFQACATLIFCLSVEAQYQWRPRLLDLMRSCQSKRGRRRQGSSFWFPHAPFLANAPRCPLPLNVQRCLPACHFSAKILKIGLCNLSSFAKKRRDYCVELHIRW